ncbi:acyltransferase, partial|nr:acyltransferase [Escherichia coli]
VLLYDESVAFPGPAALLPVLGAAALLVAGADLVDPPRVARLLAVRPLRTVGDWSYSIYLWHWPLVVIPSIRLDRSLTVTEALVAVALTVQLSYLTFRFVEQPFRRGLVWRRRPGRGLVLYPVSLALVLGVAWGSHSYATFLGSERGDDPAIRT